MDKKLTVLSGIRSTGHLHLGNYYGALRNFVRMQDEYNCYFFIADYHSLTTHPDPAALNPNVRSILSEYLAAGLDPERSVVYIQSDVPETCEVFTLLNMHAYVGELEKTVSFKDKVRKNPGNVNAGLLTYPVLMAADILQHRADIVPVGKDQIQHLEMARNYAKRFNNFYGTDLFVEPRPYEPEGETIKIPGLDGSGKMGKSEGNCIYLNDEDKDLTKKVKKAVTDMTPTEPDSPMPDAIANLFYIMKIVSAPATYAQFLAAWRDCSIRYGDLKSQLAADILKVTAPIRERYKEIYDDTAMLRRVAADGAERARANVRGTLAEMRRVMGFRPF